MRMILPRKVLFFTKWARRQRTCMYERIVNDISLSFNELRVAPLWFLWNLYLGFWKPGYKHFLWPPSSVSLLTGFDLRKAIDHNAPCLPPKVLHNHCLRFSLRRLLHLPEIGRNRYTKFGREGGGGGGGGLNKVHYGLCENGELARWSAGTDLREFFSS